VSNGSNDERLTKNERREAARAKAQQLREAQRKKDRRAKIFLQGGIVLAALAIIAVVAVVIVNSVRPAGPGPANMASDGVQLTQGFEVTPTDALEAGEDPVPNEVEGDVIDIQIYVDYLCPYCGLFEETNVDYIETLVESGAATLEVHPISILDRLSQGTRYPTRAANAAACVAQEAPASFWDFHTSLFENQPAENSTGLDDDQILDLAADAGAESEALTTCVTDQTFRSWVGEATSRATTGPIPNTDDLNLQGTPLVLVDGEQYQGALDDADAFRAFIVQAAGETFSENSTPEPTEEPTEEPAP